MRKEPPTPQLEIIGAHRGGHAYSRPLWDQRGMPALRVNLLDLEPGRPQALAKLWEEHGHAALGQVADVRHLALQPTDVRVLCLDDATAMLRLTQTAANQRLLQWGLLVNTADAGQYGGRVLGFGATLPEGDLPRRAEAQALLQRLAALVGERETSASLRAPLLNAPQVDRVREAIHQRLATDASAFLQRGAATGRLFVAEPSGARLFSLRLEARHSRTREQMRQAALRDAEGETGWQAVAFVDQRPDWLYLAFLRPRGTRRPLRYEVEFAVELPESPATTALAQWRQQQAARAEIHATD